IGIGLTIALHADIRIMADDAKYAVAQARRGVLGDCMSHWTLPNLVGISVAADLLLTGRTFDGMEAATMGIATRTVPCAEVLDEA
ncbi:crotonase, partial [Mycobacterium sp. ITM-2017-0098]